MSTLTPEQYFQLVPRSANRRKTCGIISLSITARTQDVALCESPRGQTQGHGPPRARVTSLNETCRRFLRPSHSRAPLNCSREMFSTVLSYHQVMAQFLDISLNFGTIPGLNIPTAAQHHWFHHQEFLDLDDAKRYAIPRLGRSGLDIRYCYNLWGVEKSTDKTRLWEIRQAGIYHSLDLENGRATWIHVKAHNP